MRLIELLKSNPQRESCYPNLLTYDLKLHLPLKKFNSLHWVGLLIPMRCHFSLSWQYSMTETSRFKKKTVSVQRIT